MSNEPDPYGEPQYPYGEPQYPYGEPQYPYGEPQYPYQYPPPQPYGQYGPGYPDPYAAYGYGHRAPLPPKLSDPLLGWLLLAAALLTVLGAVLPWASSFGVAVAGTTGDGRLVLGCAFVTAVCGVVIGVGQGRLWAAVTALVFGFLICLIGLVDIVNISNVALEAAIPGSFGSISIGPGLWVTLIAGLIVSGFAAAAIVRRRPVVRR